MKNVPTILLALSILIILGIVWYRYDQYVVQRNFITYAAVPCSEEEGTCFVMDCSPEEEGCDLTPYKKVEVLASEAPKCVEEHTCEAFACPAGSTTCSETFCEDETLEDGEICYAPEPEEEEIIEEAPIEEEIEEDVTPIAL